MASAQCRDTIMVAENYSHAKIYLEKGGDRNFRSFAIQKLLRLAYIPYPQNTTPIQLEFHCATLKKKVTFRAML